MRPLYFSPHLLLAAILLAHNVAGRPSPTNKRHESCTETQIPVTVSAPRYDIDVVIHDNWDAAAFTFNLTSIAFGTAIDPNPIAGNLSEPENSTFLIGATLCGQGGTVLISTHGIIESKLYFQPSLTDSEQYSFVDAAVNAGYSVLNYDRIGVGSSSKVDPYHDAQFQVQVSVLNALVSYTRETLQATKVVLVGHSYGAYLSAQSASLLGPSIDGLVLTGFSGTLQYFAPFAAGASFRVARLQDPVRWGGLSSSSGYLVSADVYAEAFAYFASPYFEHRVARWAHEVDGAPFAVGELPTLMEAGLAFGEVTAPTLVLQGRYDTSACGGDCLGLLDGLGETFAMAKVVRTVDDLPAGHDLFLHRIAPQAFEAIFNFLEEQGV